MAVSVTILGCGDAFGSGGRLNTCFLVRSDKTSFLIDCGASSMVALKRNGVDPNEIALILISHLHGDHFGGLPFFLLDAHLVSDRRVPLTIAGPPGVRARLKAAMEALFPNSSTIPWRFDLDIIELVERDDQAVGAVRVTPYEVVHGSGASPYAIRVTVEGKVVTYSGDSEWTDALIPAAHRADLFICECYQIDKDMKFHLNYQTIMNHFDELAPRRLVLTHMSDDALSRLDEIDLSKAVPAEEGMVINL